MSIADTDDPIALFGAWYKENLDSGVKNPTAMALASADERGRPSLRMVLLKDFDVRGFVFYTNFESHKGRELLANRHAALCFYWIALGRQVRVEGSVTTASDAEADAYFASRPREAQIGAWASDQSRELESRFAFEKRVAQAALKYGVGEVPRPPQWSGFRIAPDLIEFWQEGRFRLHDRLEFTRAGDSWSSRRLYP